MSEIKNNELLNGIIKYGKELVDSQNTTLTAERYIVSVIDVILGETQLKSSENAKKLLKQILLMNVSSEMQDLSNLKQCFMDHITETTASAYIDGLYMQLRLFKAKETAKKKGLDMLTPDIVLQSIFSEPNDFIKNYIHSVVETADADCYKDYVNEESVSVPDDSKIIISKLTDRVKNTHDKLIESIYGQHNAVSVFITGYFQSQILSMTDKKRTRPSATFLFAGPPGVGKTFLAEKAAEVLDIPFMRFDMSEYSDREANLQFCGSDKVYKGAKEGNVTGFVAENPECVLLFDEIEKSHINVIHLFLQILDVGRLRDSYTDKEVSFKDTIIIFTTNAGKQLYHNTDITDFSGTARKVILNALQNDINPDTGLPFFPPAICSRFASGNVVMFNHITANNLREIAKKEVLRHAENFEKQIGIKVDIDEDVYTAILFAEGGSADARAVRSRAETFFDNELFELFRLIASEKTESKIEDLESISIRVQLPDSDKEIKSLFKDDEIQDVLVFASNEIAEQYTGSCENMRFSDVQSIDAGKRFLHDSDISFVLIDLNFGCDKECKYLNIEDVESKARDFFRFVRENHPDMPIYVVSDPDNKFNPEERLSLIRQGVRGFIGLPGADENFISEMNNIYSELHQQRSINSLAKSNKLISFETAQLISNEGKNAEIRLFAFEMATAFDAEDSKNILSNVSKPDVHFDQVIGAEDAKKELMYFVEYMKNPKKYMGTGVSAPKGLLLYGPPGTGKTMLAKAMAGESEVTFITAEGNQFHKKYVGEGPEMVHELFRTARKYAPSILFIDEIDAIAKERRGGDNSQELEATLTAFLTEMDGFKNNTAKPVFVLAATNFEVEPGGDKSLDSALMRRFDRRLYIDLPNRDERIRYIKLRMEENGSFELSEDKINSIAVRSTGMSLAAISSVFELSLRTAIREGRTKVTDEIFDEAFETFNSGEIKKWDISQLERVARHESGHAFLCWQSGETPSYVTVVPRGNHGGYMQHDDGEGKGIYTKDELLAKIRISLGGRAAEIVYYGEKDGISTGASGDLESATNIARDIICTYGMDDKFGLSVINQHDAWGGVLSAEVHAEVNKILSEEMQNAIELISDNRYLIDKMVEKLLSMNHLTGSEIKEIFEGRTSQ